MDCYLCGKKTSDNHKNGIDRINNNMGYNLNNCLSCCGDCNYIKNNFLIENVINKMYKTINNIGYIDECLTVDVINTMIKYHINYFIQKTSTVIENNLNSIELYKFNEQNKIKERKHKLANNKINVNKKIENPKRIKFTNDEKRERERIRKQKQREEMKKKLGDVEYNKRRALEMKNLRDKKKLEELGD